MACISENDWKNLNRRDKILRAMAASRRLESGSFVGDYTILNKSGSTGAGAYQYLTASWRGYAKAAGIDISAYPRANMAPKSVQDAVTYHAFNNILTKFKDDIRAIPLSWFAGEGLAAKYYRGDTSILNRVAPGGNNGITYGFYCNLWAKYALCQDDSSTKFQLSGSTIDGLDSIQTFSHSWGKLPLCITNPPTGGEDVVVLKKFFGIDSGPDLYGTALQYAVTRFQIDNKLPINGCFGEKEAKILNEIPSSDSDDSDTDGDGVPDVPSFNSINYNAPVGQRMLAAARTLGNRIYVFGGGHGGNARAAALKGPLDCSSYVAAAVYIATGVDDMRTSVGYLSSPHWKRIDMALARPGDILIRTKAVSGVTHVGFVLDPKVGTVLHTNKTGTYPNIASRFPYSRFYQVCMRWVG
jgi:hypothetical protein